MTDLTNAAAFRARLREKRARDQQDPTYLAASALRTLDPDRAGRDSKRSMLEPGLAASAAERVAHLTRFNPNVVRLFGVDALNAAARVHDGSGACRWCFASRTARVHDRITPTLLVGMRQPGERSQVRLGFETLLGPACPACRTQLTADAKRCDDLRRQRTRQFTGRSAMTAAVASARTVRTTRRHRRDEQIPGYPGKSLLELVREREPW